MSKKHIKIDNTRKSVQDKIKEALGKKPSASQLSNKGITINEFKRGLDKQKGALVPRSKRIKGTNRRSRDRRPATALMHTAPKPFVAPSSNEFPVEDWFRSKGDVDVSIIVPMYKSDQVVQEQIASWDLADDGLTKEIIYVNDDCPRSSYKEVLNSWKKRKHQLKTHVGKIIFNNGNGGFSYSCNAGARFARGKYIIFLNADTIVTPNWIKPMIDLLESNEEIGIVGNMQVNGSNVDSCGSEWCWQHKSFGHIGRNSYKHKKLDRAFTLGNLPEDLKVAGEREMVTGCCIAMKKEVFYDVNGFDEQYRKGYWEDADLCMKVKEKGLKVWWTPESKIHHSVGHTGSGGHYWMKDNARIFRERWVDTGQIDHMVESKRNHAPTFVSLKDKFKGKVVGCVIACNEEEFLEVSVDSIAKVVDEWVFVIGGNNFAYKSGMCDAEGYPTDSTLEIAYKLAKKYNGTVINPPGRPWQDKVEMRNAYVPYLKEGDWMFMMDADEVYTDDQLHKIANLSSKYQCFILQFWLFWNTMDTLGNGSWGHYPQERLVRWKEGYSYRGSNHLHVSDKNGKLVHQTVPTFRGTEKLFYHYSWVRPIEKIRQKLEYYKHQIGTTQPPTYVDEVFLKWREDPASVQGRTHPVRGGGSEPFEGIHPPGIRKLIREGKFDF